MGRSSLRRAGMLAAAALAAGCAVAALADAPAEAPAAVIDPLSLALFVLLISMSAFFSASEMAFFSLHKIELRAMEESEHFLDRLAAKLMKRPGDLLTSLLMWNCIVNVVLGIVSAEPMEAFVERVSRLPPAAAYAISVAAITLLIVFFGEVLPKIVVVRHSQHFAALFAPAVWIADIAIYPLRVGVLGITSLIFRVTGFSKLAPAPFMTNDDFKSLVSDSEAWGVIETEERQMIEGILEFGELQVREILVPRPDVVALPHTATVREALERYRKEQCARMPAYSDGLDHIEGVLFAKDLLRKVTRGELDEPIQPLLRKANFVPETMSIADFMKVAQRTRTHMAIVVDEYGGTEGIATLHDALSAVIGAIGDEEEEAEYCHDLGGGAYRVDGTFTVHDLESLTNLKLPDDGAATIAGFLMAQSEKVLERGDEIVFEGVTFRVEKMTGRRVVKVRIQAPTAAPVPAAEAQP